MFSNLIKSGILLMALVCFTGCATKPVNEKKVDEALKKGNAVVIFYGTSENTWGYKGNPNLDFTPTPNGSDDVFTLLELTPGTYYYSTAGWTNKMNHQSYNTIPNVLSSSLGKVLWANTMVTEKRSREVRVWYPDEGYTQEIFNQYGKIGEQFILTRRAGYRNETEYYNVDVPAVETALILNSLSDSGEANFASFELKAGDVVVVDSLLLAEINGDIHSCAARQQDKLKYVSCPITSISLQYIPSSYFQFNDFLAKNLSEQQIKKLVRKPLKLGVLIPNKPSGKSQNGFDIYTIYKK